MDKSNRRRGAYLKRECSDEIYERDKSVLFGNKTSYKEHIVGDRKSIFIDGILVSTVVGKKALNLGGLSTIKFIALLGRFNKQLYKLFRTNPALYDIKISHIAAVSGRNDKIWDTLPVGATFYNVDIKKAFWQSGYLLGYIESHFFEEFINYDLYKNGLRYCFSFLARGNETVYHTPNGSTKITCETDVLHDVLNNVRNKLFNDINSIKVKCNTVVEWNSDGISILGEDLNFVRSKMTELNYFYKISLCRKVDEYKYSQGSRIKPYKSKPKIKK